MIRTCYVYLYVNTRNKKAYVGKTFKLSLREYLHRYAANVRHVDTYFYNAIRKYGFDVFKRVLIASCSSDEEALSLEKRLIPEFKRLGFKLYNSTSGGDDLLNPSQETRQKIRDGQKNRRPWTAEDKSKLSQRVSGSGNPMFGRKHSTASIEKNAASNRVATAGEKNGMFGRKHTPESRELMSAGHRGFVPSETTRALWSERRRGEGNSFFGKQHSDASKVKIKQAATLREERKRLLRANSELAPFDVWV
jgi:group I intron endonuclease